MTDPSTAITLPGEYQDLAQAELRSLVLLSVNISHRLLAGPNGWQLEVAAAEREAAQRQLAAFEEENRHWPPPLADPPVMGPGQGWWVMTMLAGLVALHGLTGAWDNDSPWFQRGMVDGGLVLRGGEWWRVATGLTLHADVSHLTGNVALGGLALYYLAARVGGGAACFLALATGGLANYANVLAHGTQHRFIGFSSAVFGVIGCLCGIRMRDGLPFRALLLPLGAGLSLLAMLGTEGVKTDVGAHLWGLGIGAAAGLCWRLPASGGDSRFWQLGLGLGSLTLLVVCWLLAWR